MTPFSQALLGVLLLALVLRVCNLGCFSLWLDEVFQVQRSHGSLAEAWFPTSVDVHPPLSALVMTFGYRLGLSDTAQRLVPVGLGGLSILLLVAWARRRFGDVVALTVGSLAALSPFHLRYSQELRPYPYLLFFVVLSLVVVDRAVEHGRVGWAVPCGLVFAGGLYSHALFPLVAAPIVASALLLDRQARKKACITVPLAAGIGLALFLPWLPQLLRTAAAAGEPSAQSWTWRALARRWQFLTVGGWEGADLTWGGAVLLVLALLGVVRALRLRRRGGFEVIVGAAVGLVGVELLFQFAWQRWSVGRYSIIGWPFLVVLVALGVEWVVQYRIRVLGVATALALLGFHAGGLWEYATRGREQWERMVDVLREVHRPGEPVLTENLFCQYPIEYYLRGPGSNRDPGAARIMVLPLDRDLDRLLDLWPLDRSCLLVRGGTPHSPRIRRIASYSPMIAGYSQSQWLYRLPPRSTVSVTPDGTVAFQPLAPGEAWPDPSLVLLPPELRDPPATWFDRALRSGRGSPVDETALLQFDRESSARNLVSGWSGFESTSTATTFVWAVGFEAGVVFASSAVDSITIRARLWPFEAPGQVQQVRALVNGHEIGVARLASGPQTLEAPASASALRPGPNLLVFQFAYALAPATVDSSSDDQRPLACAFDWIAFQRDQPE